MRGAAGTAASLLASVAEDSGDFGRAEAAAAVVAPLPFALGLRKGEAVRLALAGVPVREGGLLGRLMLGLSQEEKKSSSAGSPAGVTVPEPSASGASVMMTSSGYLEGMC